MRFPAAAQEAQVRRTNALRAAAGKNNVHRIMSNMRIVLYLLHTQPKISLN